ncbi:hypothetical protein HPP92_000231 [Vanilla planifolia]|uniref:mRNA cap-binding protein n=1 Tax=Vanilla planifolia TaxID=51239 RepID=A0A835S2G5_VANPL|nr:hypothetical protein HPP92_000231 [Vanilla planifolia]
MRAFFTTKMRQMATVVEDGIESVLIWFKFSGKHVTEELKSLIKFIGCSIASNHCVRGDNILFNLHNNIHKPSKFGIGADFHCFKHGIEPKWEDPVCANGGKWTISCSRVKVDLWWLYTLLAMLGEQFDQGDEICGAVVNIRAKQEKISIWTKNGLNEAAQFKLQFYFTCMQITITYDDGHAVKGKGIYRKVMDKLFLMCSSELGGKQIVYDGENCFFTVGKLSRQNFDLIVTLYCTYFLKPLSLIEFLVEALVARAHVLVFRSSQGAHFLQKAFNIQIRYATEIPFRVIELAVKGSETEQTKDAVKVLNAILRQRHAKKFVIWGCLLVRQSYFGCDPANFTELDGGLIGCGGFHSIFCTTKSGLYLNMNVSNTLMVKPGPVIDFLISNQNVRNAKEVDWAKALQENQYDNDPLLCSFGITIKKQLTEIDGCVLSTPTFQLLFFPQLKVDNQEQCVPKNGRWNFEDKKLLQAIPIECWAIVSFSARCDLSHLSREMINCGRSKGIIINRPFPIIEESHQCARMGPSERVETIFEEVIKRLPGPPQLLLCVLPERKNSPTYDCF